MEVTCSNLFQSKVLLQCSRNECGEGSSTDTSTNHCSFENVDKVHDRPYIPGTVPLLHQLTIPLALLGFVLPLLQLTLIMFEIQKIIMYLDSSCNPSHQRIKP
jgi:hypothetical protein